MSHDTVYLSRESVIESILTGLLRDAPPSIAIDTLKYRRVTQSLHVIAHCQAARLFDQMLISSAPDDRVNQYLQYCGVTIQNIPTRLTPVEVIWIRQFLSLLTKLPGLSIKDPVLEEAEVSLRLNRSGVHTLILDSDKELAKSLLGPCPRVSQLRGQHGPGDVYDKSYGAAKFAWAHSVPAPFDELRFVNEVHELASYLSSPPCPRQLPSRLVFVPKDFRGRRAIAVEHKESMWAQQAVKRYLYDRLPRSTLLRGRPGINFVDQAAHASLISTGDYVTIDMKDASDMVSRRLLASLLPREWWVMVRNLRSHFVEIGGKPIINRAAFTMGNALCFPIESLVHYIAVRRAVPFEYDVSVYGDDLIVPRKFGYAVLEALKSFGLRPNDHKCCLSGYFRETCGFDYWKGVFVTPVRIKLSDGRRESSYLRAMSLLSCQQGLWRNGLHSAANALRNVISAWLDLPTWSRDHAGGSYFLGYVDASPRRTRWNTGLQRREYRIPLCQETRTKSLRGFTGLLSFFSTGSGSVVSKLRTPVYRWVWERLDLPL